MESQPTPLEAKIRKIIAAKGLIAIDEFMALCLYDGEFGYYKTHNPIGANADFITAPEISQMFGETLGIWLKIKWEALNRPQHINIIELGPGRGTLANDALRTFAKLTNNSVNIALGLVETNPNLQLRQNALLERYSPVFAPTLMDLVSKTNDHPIILIANEFLDCLPIGQYINTQNGWRERKITIDAQNNLAFTIDTEVPIRAPNFPKDAPINALYEHAHGLKPLFEEVDALFNGKLGAAIFIDYGPISNSFGDSLQAIIKHQKTSPLSNLGDADLTAHVNFDAVAKEALNIGGTIETLCTQKEFLCNYGILERAKALIDINPSRKSQIENDLSRLIGLDQMGELFKTIVVNFGKRNN